MSTTSRRTAPRRRRKKKNPTLRYLVTFLVLTVLIVAAFFLMQDGYDRYVKSGFRIEHYDTVMKAAADFDVSPSLILGIIRTESGFDERAHSHADAYGLMQVTEDTLTWLHLRSDEFDDVTVDDLYDPVTNIRCGTFTLHLLMERYEAESTVVAAYNGGLGNVDEWLLDARYSADGKTLHTIPFEETRNYVERVQTSKDIYENYYHITEPKGEH